ncbi:ABC transporter substrate-binding protein [Streptomyces sp. NPDC054796]
MYRSLAPRRPTGPRVRTLPRTAAVAGALLVALTAAACGGGSGSGDGKSGGKDTVNVGAIPIVDTAPAYLAEKRGFFGKHGIKAKITPVQGGAAGVSGVMGGQFDFAFGNTTSLLTGRDQGLPLKAVASGVASTGEPGKDYSAVLVGEDSGISSAEDLAGRTIAVNQLKNIGDTTVKETVREHGGDPSGIEFTEMPFPDMPAALDKGRVDAIWVVEPFVTQARDQGAKPVAWNFAEATDDDLTVAMYFTTEKLLKEKPDLAERFTAAIEEANAYAAEHPDAVREVLRGYAEIPEPVAEKMVLPKWPADINTGSVREIGALAREDGVLKKEADVDALLP